MPERVVWPFPITESGAEIDMAAGLDLLAPGVRGYAVVEGGCAYIPLIQAEQEGSGDVGRFLDGLPLGVKIANVTSGRLRGMLTRRGFRMSLEEECDVWMKDDDRPERGGAR